MSAGAGSGGINLWVFEVGMVVTDPVSGTEVVTTVSVHPLVTVPTSVSYQDNSRAALAETTGGSLVTKAGRALRTVNMSGTFGVESRGLGPYIGTGKIRRERFYNEVVRMADALTAEDVDAAVDVISGTPFISLLVKPYVPDATVFFINFYDFLNDVSFECLLNYSSSIQARDGGATGMQRYTMQVREVGPLKTGSAGSAIISGLMSVLGTWSDINSLVSGTTVTDILDAQGGVLAIGAAQVAGSVDALGAQLDAVQALMGGSSSSRLVTTASLNGISSFLQNAQDAQQGLVGAVASLNQIFGTGDFDNTTGAIDPAAVPGEGSNPFLDLFGDMATLSDMADAAAFQHASGGYFGMGRSSFADFISGGGTRSFSGPDYSGALPHIVASTDTPASLEAQYGTAWSDLVALNGLTPDEAMLPGTELHIPIKRSRGVQGINGLPTFGSHVGKAAWGADLAMALEIDEDGEPVLVQDEAALVQGMEFLIEVFGDDVLTSSQNIPSTAQASYISQRLQSLFKTDRRIVGVDRLTVVLNPAGGYDTDVTLYAINGGTVRTGALAT